MFRSFKKNPQGKPTVKYVQNMNYIKIMIHDVDILESTVGAEMRRNIPHGDITINSSVALHLLWKLTLK